MSIPISVVPQSPVASRRTTIVALESAVNVRDLEVQVAAVVYVATAEPKVAPPSVETKIFKASVPVVFI